MEDMSQVKRRHTDYGNPGICPPRRVTKLTTFAGYNWPPCRGSASGTRKEQAEWMRAAETTQQSRRPKDKRKASQSPGSERTKLLERAWP